MENKSNSIGDFNDYEDLINHLSESIKETSYLDNELFKKYNVKRGLRNEDHSGVLVGLTNIGDVEGYKKQENGSVIPLDGRLFYRGIEIKDLVEGIQKEDRHGFEETVYLLLSGKLPQKENLKEFTELLASKRSLDSNLKMSIMELRGKDVMNILARTVMVMYANDCCGDDISEKNLIKQSLNLIAKFPTIISYAYHSIQHYYNDETLSIRHPNPELSLAENFLSMLKGDGRYSALDAQVLDLALMLHAEHGGGNNSTFTVRVTSSSGTDTYSAITAAIGSLKGPLHGGANLRVREMFDHLKETIKNWKDDKEIAGYLLKMLNMEAYNRTGKIYGIGHAVYTKSDPRVVLLKKMARALAEEKNRLDEYDFLAKIERNAIETFMSYKGSEVGKVVCANVDFYSGFVYDLIGLPVEIYTPLFAMARIAGWCAHRIEELNFDKKRIIRPAYKNVVTRTNFVKLEDRG
jgi:citrate synthase